MIAGCSDSTRSQETPDAATNPDAAGPDASSTPDGGAHDAAPFVPFDASPSDAALTCSIAGTWLVHHELTECGGSGNATMTLSLGAPGAFTVTLPGPSSDSVTETGVIGGNQITIYDSQGAISGYAGSVDYLGTVDGSCTRMEGYVGGECVNGTWTAEKQ